MERAFPRTGFETALKRVKDGVSSVRGTAVAAVGIPTVALLATATTAESAWTVSLVAATASLVAGIMAWRRLLRSEKESASELWRSRRAEWAGKHPDSERFEFTTLPDGKPFSEPNHARASLFRTSASELSSKVFATGESCSAYVHFREPLGSYWYMADRFFEHNAAPVFDGSRTVAFVHHSFRKLENSEIYGKIPEDVPQPQPSSDEGIGVR